MFVEPDPLGVGVELFERLFDLLVEPADLFFEGFDPGRLFGGGFDPSFEVDQSSAEGEPVGGFADLAALLFDLLEFLRSLLDQRFDLDELIRGVVGEFGLGFGLCDFAGERVPFGPRVEDVGRGLDASGFAFPALDALAELFDFLLAGTSEGGEFAPPASESGEVFDLVAEPIPLGEQSRQLASFGVVLSGGASDQVLSAEPERPHHVDERDPIEAAGEFVQLVGGGGIVEGAQFLQFADADREHVGEDRLVDLSEQGRQPVFALDQAVLSGDREPSGGVAVGELAVATDFVTAAGAGDADRAAGGTAVDGRQVALAARFGEPVEHRAEELHHRRLARFVRAVEQRHPFGHRIDRESGPDSEPVDLNVFDFHD